MTPQGQTADTGAAAQLHCPCADVAAVCVCSGAGPACSSECGKSCWGETGKDCQTRKHEALARYHMVVQDTTDMQLNTCIFLSCSDSYQMCIRLPAVQRASSQRLLSHSLCSWMHRTQGLGLSGENLTHLDDVLQSLLKYLIFIAWSRCALLLSPCRHVATSTTVACARKTVLRPQSTTLSLSRPSPTQTRSSALEPLASRPVHVRF